MWGLLRDWKVVERGLVIPPVCGGEVISSFRRGEQGMCVMSGEVCRIPISSS